MERDKDLGNIEQFPVVWDTIRSIRRMEVYNSLSAAQQEVLEAYAHATAESLRRALHLHSRERRIAAAEVVGERYESLTKSNVQLGTIKSVEVIALQEVLRSEVRPK